MEDWKQLELEQLDQNFAEVLSKLQRMNPIMAKALTDDAAELQRKSENIYEKLEEIKNLTEATGLISSETESKQSEVEQSLEELERINNQTATALDTLEELLNRKLFFINLIFTLFSAQEEDKIADLKKKNEEIIAINNDFSDKTANITKIIETMQNSIITSRKKRNLRKLRSHKKRQAELSGKQITRDSENNQKFKQRKKFWISTVKLMRFSKILRSIEMKSIILTWN